MTRTLPDPITDRETATQPDASNCDAAARSSDQAETEVIVIDDDPAVLATTAILLRDRGFRVRLFTDPLEALLWASDVEPTCLIVDLRLPGIEGLDLVAAFCALRRHAVVLISAYVDVLTTVDAMRLGVHNVLVKPFAPGELIRAVEQGRAYLAVATIDDVLTFTRRERQVAEHIVAGRTTKQIAQELVLSPRTVDFFRGSLLRKTQSPNTAALVAALARIGFG